MEMIVALVNSGLETYLWFSMYLCSKNVEIRMSAILK